MTLSISTGTELREWSSLYISTLRQNEIIKDESTKMVLNFKIKYQLKNISELSSFLLGWDVQFFQSMMIG